MFNLPHCYNSENRLTEIAKKETSALYTALDSPGLLDDFANLALQGQEDHLNSFSVAKTLQLYLYVLEKIRAMEELLFLRKNLRKTS